MTPADAVKPGVAIIKGRITGAAVMAQKIQAESQPEDEPFDGMAENARTGVRHGADLFGTAVRMIRASRARPGTKSQKLKSLALFIFVTGIQRVTDIRQHHLDHFAKAMETKIPRFYWKSHQDMEITWHELLNVTRRDPEAEVGLSPSTIECHLNTIRAVIMKADDEENPCGFAPRVHNLAPSEHPVIFSDSGDAGTGAGSRVGFWGRFGVGVSVSTALPSFRRASPGSAAT